MNKINGVHINSITYGNPQGQDVVLLHGWGQNIEMMKPIGDSLQKEYLVTIIDLPGHGTDRNRTMSGGNHAGDRHGRTICKKEQNSKRTDLVRI